jgi:hypothetical protein
VATPAARAWRQLPGIVLASGATLLAGCRGSQGPASPGTPAPPSGTPVITISAGGVNPKNVEVAIGGRVRFVNSDAAEHFVGSDPHPDHTDCPDINQVGFLLSGQVRETGNFVQPRTCGFHDHQRPEVQALRGTITIR